MALPPLQDLLDLLPDNTVGDISAQDMRDIVTALYDGIGSAGGGSGGGSIPVGGILPWPDTTLPAGFLDCNGAAVNRTTYAALFAVIGTKYGVGDGSTTFNLPDYRGYFWRIQDAGAGRDPDRASRTNRGDGTIGDAVGTKQEDQFESHLHELRLATGGPTGSTAYRGSGSQAAIQDTNMTGGNETRGKNVYIRSLIRYEQTVTDFVSSDIVLTAGSKALGLVAHGLGLVPSYVSAHLKCVTTDLGWSAGDEVFLAELGAASTNGIQVGANSTNIKAVQNGDIQILNYSTFAMATINYANWVLVFRAKK